MKNIHPNIAKLHLTALQNYKNNPIAKKYLKNVSNKKKIESAIKFFENKETKTNQNIKKIKYYKNILNLKKKYNKGGLTNKNQNQIQEWNKDKTLNFYKKNLIEN